MYGGNGHGHDGATVTITSMGVAQNIGNADVTYAPRKIPGMRVQAVRSVSDWSHGVLTEHSIQNACPYPRFYMSLVLTIYISESSVGVSRTSSSEDAGWAEVPGFSGHIKDQSSIKTIMAAQTDYIRFYHLRAYDRINAPLSTYIEKIEADSGVKFLAAQVALARQWIGDDSDGAQKAVTVMIPVETAEGIVVSDKAPLKTETVPIPESEDAARQVIERFEAAAPTLTPAPRQLIAHIAMQRWGPHRTL
ncbi:hypothetical protein GGX14DRAFT_679100 [Mycena pura]|uniref:Uncharacterized protein n=1 Tax=Mycena pura TaxID=153505 RepID=A0AAD6UT72_9AGAR|nr:hypothetical protein GGX14DRAFT_679100 [Mycena pura]